MITNWVPPSQPIRSVLIESIRASVGASLSSRARNSCTAVPGPSISITTPALSFATDPASPSRRASA